MQGQGFGCTQVPSFPLEPAIESERMRRRALTTEPADVQAAKAVLRGMAPTLAEQDVVQLVCQRAKP